MSHPIERNQAIQAVLASVGMQILKIELAKAKKDLEAANDLLAVERQVNKFLTNQLHELQQSMVETATAEPINAESHITGASPCSQCDTQDCCKAAAPEGLDCKPLDPALNPQIPAFVVDLLKQLGIAGQGDIKVYVMEHA